MDQDEYNNYLLPLAPEKAEFSEIVERSKQLIAQSKELQEHAKKVGLQSLTVRKAANVLLHWAETHGVVKSCTCGLSFQPSDWLRLDMVGFTSFGSKVGEFRNCHQCGSTLLLITSTTAHAR